MEKEGSCCSRDHVNDSVTQVEVRQFSWLAANRWSTGIRAPSPRMIASPWSTASSDVPGCRRPGDFAAAIRVLSNFDLVTLS